MHFWPRRDSARRRSRCQGDRQPRHRRTCGVCDVFPGAVNSIPSRVRLEVDVRDIDLAAATVFLRAIAAATEEAAERRRVTVRTEVVNADAPAMCAPHVVEVLEPPAKRIKRLMKS